MIDSIEVALRAWSDTPSNETEFGLSRMEPKMCAAIAAYLRAEHAKHGSRRRDIVCMADKVERGRASDAGEAVG